MRGFARNRYVAFVLLVLDFSEGLLLVCVVAFCFATQPIEQIAFFEMLDERIRMPL